MFRLSRAGFTFLMLFGVFNSPILFGQNVVVVYYSEHGHTKAMAEAVAKGAGTSTDAKVRLLSVDKATGDDLLWADAVVIGSPVHSANVAAPIQEFLSHMPWDQKMKDKIGAGFVTGGGISSGEELAQLNILHSMLIYNMIVVGGPTWNQAFGASGTTEEDPFAGQTKPTFLAKGEARPGAVVRQTHRSGAVSQIRLLADYEPPKRIKYVIFVAGMETWEFDTRLEPTPEGKTRVEVHHRITSLAERVNKEVQHFADGFDAYVERVRVALSKALENRRDK